MLMMVGFLAPAAAIPSLWSGEETFPLDKHGESAVVALKFQDAKEAFFYSVKHMLAQGFW
jgi:hypothetical protein